jgi:membrane protein implicated in regulation of membrane protease activity
LFYKEGSTLAGEAPMDYLVYTICLGIGLAFTLCTVIAGHFFGGHEGHLDGSGGHAEVGADGSDMPGVSIFSPTVIAIFITAFGAFGLIFTQFDATKRTFVSAPLAVVGGALVAGAVVSLLRQLFKRTQGSSESRVASLVGMTATIITPIPENGVGEIAYVQGGSRYTAPAREEHGAAVPNGRVVKISRIVGTQFYVVPT